MPKLIADGSHYIQKSNQDYWLRLNGVWVRMGNIRDEGTGGLVTVPPIVAQGLDLDVTHLDRWRYVPDEAGFSEGLGFDTTIAALDRIRYIAGVGESVGFAISPLIVDRVRQLSAAFNMGFINSAQLTREVMLQAAMSLGFTETAELDAAVEVDFVVPMSLGFTTLASITKSKMLSAAMGLGFSESVALTGSAQLSAAMGLGFDTAATVDANVSFVAPMSLGFSAAVNVTKSKMISAAFSLGYLQGVGIRLVPPLSVGYTMSAPTLMRIKLLSPSFAVGFDTAAAVSFTIGNIYLPTNTTLGASIGTPTAVNTDFTFTASGNAAESHLYDGDDTTPAATPTGLQTTTHAAYDFGAPVAVNGARIYTANANGFANNATFKVQYSDASLTTGWNDIGTITVLAGTGVAYFSGLFATDLHRYWRIIYSSGTTLGNAWIGELSFCKSAPWGIGLGMSVVLTGSVVLPAAAPALGFSMSAPTLSKIKAVTAAMAEGFSMSAPTLSLSANLTAAMAMGFSDAVTLTHTPTGVTQTPVAVLTTFTYTGQTPAAAESHLYDGVDSTDAADPLGVQTTTSAAYDLGAAKTIASIRIITSNRFAASTTYTMKVQYNDSGLSSAWTDSGTTIVIPAAVSTVNTAGISAGSHRYWRIVYLSGTTGQNAWLGELQFKN